MWEMIQNLDNNVLLYIQDHFRMEELTFFFKNFTILGNNGMIWIIFGGTGLLFVTIRRGGVCTLLSIGLCFIVVNLTLKNLIARPRPYEAMEAIRILIPPEKDTSFPSGHTATAFAGAVAIALEMDTAFGLVCVAIAILMGISRLYVGVHYPTDVLAGAAIGIFCALFICYYLVPRVERSYERMTK